jgi:hypothetical protein
MNGRTLLIAGLMGILFGCNNKNTSEFTTIKVQNVEQVGSYTYLLVKEKGRGPEYWVAVTSIQTSPGETYHYQGGLRMEDFHSNELDRTFESVLFLDAIYPGEAPRSGTFTEQEGTMGQAMTPEGQEAIPIHGASQGDTPGSRVVSVKSDIRVEHAEGAVSIAALFADPAAFKGRTIRVTGQVTRFNPYIMDRNWVHLQDGTEYEGKFDLTVTTDEFFETGNTVTLEGTLALNLDFGYGYSYELLLENAKAVD